MILIRHKYAAAMRNTYYTNMVNQPITILINRETI
jgi:hypothetical protein